MLAVTLNWWQLLLLIGGSGVVCIVLACVAFWAYIFFFWDGR